MPLLINKYLKYVSDYKQKYGNMIGVAVSKLSYKKILEDYDVVPENTNFGIKASIVKNLLQGNGINVPSANTKSISRSERNRIIQGGTYYLSCWMTMAQIQKMKAKKVMFPNLKPD